MNLLWAVSSLQKQDYNECRDRHYELAAQYPLRTVNDHVAALVHVANISIRQGNYEKAEVYLQLALKDRDKVTAKMLAADRQVEGRRLRNIKP